MSKHNVILSSVHEQEVMKYKTEIHDLHTQLEQNQIQLEEIANSLSSVIEQGNPLFIGIILGQSLQKLIAIAYK